MDIRKVYLLILLCTFCILSPVYTQQSLSDEFRKVAGDYAALYTSKVEVGYSPYLIGIRMSLRKERFAMVG